LLSKIFLERRPLGKRHPCVLLPKEALAPIGPTELLCKSFGISDLDQHQEEFFRCPSPMTRFARFSFPEWAGTAEKRGAGKTNSMESHYEEKGARKRHP
jgi:hypothetical protein